MYIDKLCADLKHILDHGTTDQVFDLMRLNKVLGETVLLTHRSKDLPVFIQKASSENSDILDSASLGETVVD